MSASMSVFVCACTFVFAEMCSVCVCLCLCEKEGVCARAHNHTVLSEEFMFEEESSFHAQIVLQYRT